MTRSKRDKKRKASPRTPGDPSVSGGRSLRPQPGSTFGSAHGWIYARRPVLGFVVLFAVFMGLFYAITFIPAVNQGVIPYYMRLNARVSKVIINGFGEGAWTDGTRIVSPRYSVDIQHGCDAIAPTALFVSAVLAFPAPMLSKLLGVIVGALLLAVVNLIRIVALFFTGIYWPSAFEVMHVDVWQPVFIVLALSLWVGWAWWATGSKMARPDVSAATN